MSVVPGGVGPDLSPLAAAVRRDESNRGQTPQGAGAGECPPQAPSCGCRAGQSDAQGVSRGKLLSPERRRRAVCVLQDRFRVSQRRACRLAGQNRNTQRRPVPVTAIDEQKLRRRIRELARRHVRWGRRLVYRRLRLEGWTVNHKRVQRIWREEGLQRPLLRRRKRSRPPGGKRELLRAEYPHHV